jgi:3-hydroxyacyl-[acyl-carrier-protein] dehydratase
VTEQENLPCGLARARPPLDAQVIASVPLPEELHSRTTLAPLRCHHASEAVHCRFVEAGRFGANELFKEPHNLRLALASVPEQVFHWWWKGVCCGHGGWNGNSTAPAQQSWLLSFPRRAAEAGCPYSGAFAYNYPIARSSKHAAGALFEDKSMILDVNGIQKILPHRYPFLMVDAILEMERHKRIVGIKNVTYTEFWFPGHFPGKPVMPGVLIIEAMAQCGGLLLLQEVEDRENKLLYFAAIDECRFRRPVIPGDQLRIEMEAVSWKLNVCKLRGQASVNGEVACEATLMCKMVDR